MPDAAYDPYEGMDPIFAQQLQQLIAASGGKLYIESGYRDEAKQVALFNAAVQKYGSEEAARKWVAMPESMGGKGSNHTHGVAADLGGDLQVAHQLAAQFGLVFPMDYEDWHIELAGARDKTDDTAYSTPPPGVASPKQADWSGDPSKVAAMLSESLLGLAIGDLSMSAMTTNVSGEDAQVGALPTTGSSTGAAAYGGVDSAKWATDFLVGLGMPVTPENMRAVTAWQQAESGGGGGQFNPLNTTQGGFEGETDYNDVGVKNYASYQDGIAANIKVINNGRYQPILDALRAGDNAMAVADAIAQTPWGSGELVKSVLGGS